MTSKESSSSLIIDDLSSDFVVLKSDVVGLDASNFTDVMKQLNLFDKRLQRQELINENKMNASSTTVNTDRDRLKHLRSDFKQLKVLFRNLNKNVELSNSVALLKQRNDSDSLSSSYVVDFVYNLFCGLFLGLDTDERTIACVLFFDFVELRKETLRYC
jgi:hypothetical protein